MKTLKVNFLIAIAMLVAFNVQAERTTKKVYKSYALSQVQKIGVSNKYGHIYIDDNRKDSVIINVEIWVEGTNERARNLLDKINVSVNLSGNTVVAVTNLENINNNNQSFSIDYHISVPADRDLAVDQKYGTVTMKNLTGKGKFEIKYGELTAQKLLSPDLNMDIAYSKANIEESKDLDLVLRYSKISLDKGANLKTETRYSEINLGDVLGIKTDSRYDHYKIKTVGTLNMNSMYTGTQVDKLSSKLTIENGYGNLTIDEIPASFESINIINKYAGIKLGIASDASYKLDGKVRYCELKHPDGKFMNRMRENTSYEVNGIIGKVDNPKSKVTIESSYGSVNLMR
jgi:hypothetical protein